LADHLTGLESVDGNGRSISAQAQVAARVGKDHSFMSLIEGSQRRVDVLEFYALAGAMGADPVELFEAVTAKLPDKVSI
jgi:hypothetical protein